MTANRHELGARLLAMARAWFDAATVERVFEPLIADWQRECGPKSGLARVACRISGAAAFAMSFALTFATQFRKPLPDGLSGAAWRTLHLFVGLGMIALYVPFALNSPGSFEGLLPATLGFALPIAITPFTIVLLRRRDWPARDLRKAALRLALITTLVMIPLLGWGVPYTNQQWRIVNNPHQHSQPARGVRELTLPELWSATPPRDVRWSAAIQRKELINRTSLMSLPLPLVILGIASARIRRARIAWACFWWVAPPMMLPVLSWWRTVFILLAVAAAIHVLTRSNTEMPHVETL